jgi:hypothetical protein
MQIIKRTRYIADGCGKGFSSKKRCLKHEDVCKCWKNPIFKTCLSCKFQAKRGDFCNNPAFDYDVHFKAAFNQCEDLCINCPLWEQKDVQKVRNNKLKDILKYIKNENN